MGMGNETYDASSVSVPPIRIVHRRDINPTPMHDIVIRDHDPCERSQEHGISAHESDESLDAKRVEAPPVEPTRDRKKQVGDGPT